jgi:divalent metal cation (Fe/Co/Zn/Cd) transporter
MLRATDWYPYTMSELTIARQATAHRGRRLEYFTIAWNSLEGLVAVAAGAVAGSISLVGFGIDSFIEVTSGAALLWRMSVDANLESRERNEKRSLRIVGGCFIALAVYICYEAISGLVKETAPEHSIPGIVLACVSLYSVWKVCNKICNCRNRRSSSLVISNRVGSGM